MTWRKRLRSDETYLALVDRAERQLAKILAGGLLLCGTPTAVFADFGASIAVHTCGHGALGR